MYIGVSVDESTILKNQLITTQSMPEGMCETLNLNVSILLYVFNMLCILKNMNLVIYISL